MNDKMKIEPYGYVEAVVQDDGRWKIEMFAETTRSLMPMRKALYSWLRKKDMKYSIMIQRGNIRPYVLAWCDV